MLDSASEPLAPPIPGPPAAKKTKTAKMPAVTQPAVVALALAALTVAGCSTDLSRSFGFVRDAPDEYTVTTQVPALDAARVQHPPADSGRQPAAGADHATTGRGSAGAADRADRRAQRGAQLRPGRPGRRGRPDAALEHPRRGQRRGPGRGGTEPHLRRHPDVLARAAARPASSSTRRRRRSGSARTPRSDAPRKRATPRSSSRAAKAGWRASSDPRPRAPILPNAAGGHDRGAPGRSLARSRPRISSRSATRRSSPAAAPTICHAAAAIRPWCMASSRTPCWGSASPVRAAGP